MLHETIYEAFIRVDNIAGVIVFADWLKAHIRPLINERKEKKQLQNELFTFLEKNVYCDMGFVHPYLVERKLPHPDNEKALGEISHSIYNYFRGNREIIYAKNVGYVDLKENVCSLGSPVSSRLSRKGMGYPLEGNLGKEPSTKLPFIFNLNEKDLGEVTRMMKGKKWTVKNWAIINRDSGEEFEPRFNPDGYLKTDYLLITIIPNFLTEQGMRNNKVLGMIGGCHGPGTKAIGKVLEDVKLLEKMKKEKGDYDYYQSLFKISKLKHTKTDCIPVKVDHVKTIPLDLNL